jgi:hypothetical protein
MRSKLLGEEMMDTGMERRVARRVRSGRARWISGAAHDLAGEVLPFQDPRRGFEFHPDTQLPPPRAARTPRSRGIFFKAAQPPKKQSAWRRTDLSIVALAVAVVAIASALIVGAPNATIMASGAHFNPGPAMVGAASVPPAFIAPPRTR